MTTDDHSGLGDLADGIAEELEVIEERSPLARTLITVVATLIVAGVVIGALIAVSVAMRDTETARSSVDATDLPQVVLRAESADVRIVEGDTEDIDIEASVTSGLLGTDYELRRRGPEIEIVSGCLAVLNPGCGVEVTVTVPAGLPVEVATGSGDIVADGLGDRVLTLAAASGDIRARDLEVDELSATAADGDVDASFVGEPFAVKASTDSGDVDLVMASGEREYQVDVLTETGELEQDMESVEESSGFVRVRSDSGDISLARP
ncbi:DUF4097 family beta strand repeat-containing protein [Aeromicrobium sp. CF4.19]|uniref:DUF4097 family beta strand repeat-containing protein n=1 Tax=Aeromicrobium sp. CF4.19 TaxID=3373082 RepID=UPI003EE5FF1A